METLESSASKPIGAASSREITAITVPEHRATRNAEIKMNRKNFQDGKRGQCKSIGIDEGLLCVLQSTVF